VLKTIRSILFGRLILMPAVAISTLLVSNALGPAGFGFVASVVAISTFFSVTLLGPPTALLLKKSIRVEVEPTISIGKFYLFSGCVYFLFLAFLFLIEDARILNSAGLIFLCLTYFSGVNSLIATYFFAIKRTYIFNWHSVLPEIVFLIVILVLTLSLNDLTINVVLGAWIVQTVVVCLLVLYRRKTIFRHIFNRKYLKRDYTSFFLLGLQNMGRDRALLLIGPIVFSLSEIGKLAFYIMIARVFISLNGTVSNLVMTEYHHFQRHPEILRMWIIVLLGISCLFFGVLYVFNQTNILTAFHISLSQMLAMSLALCGSLIFSLLLRVVYIRHNLFKFTRYQMLITIIVLALALLTKDFFDLFTIHMFIVCSMALSVGTYMLVMEEVKN
jgi:hypothetical protein